MAAYLTKVGWVPGPQGIIDMPSGHRIDLSNNQPEKFESYAGSPGPPLCSPPLMPKLSDQELKLLCLSLTGGFPHHGKGYSHRFAVEAACRD